MGVILWFLMGDNVIKGEHEKKANILIMLAFVIVCDSLDFQN